MFSIEHILAVPLRKDGLEANTVRAEIVGELRITECSIASDTARRQKGTDPERLLKCK